MAISPTDANLPDFLSSLPDALLITILSLLPTHIAACTSVLSRRFRHLWEASPSLELVNRYRVNPSDDKFIPMATRAILNRNPSHPVLSLHIQIVGWSRYNTAFVSSLLHKVCSFSLRHLNIECRSFKLMYPILPAILTMESLESLSLSTVKPLPGPYVEEEYVLPSAISLTRLKSLYLEIYDAKFIKFDQLLSELVSLEDLHLGVSAITEFALSSLTLTKLELIILERQRLLFDILRLSLPLLEVFHLENHCFRRVPYFEEEVPSLKKVVLNLGIISKEDGNVVRSLVNFISHVEELSLHIKDNEIEIYPIPNLWDENEDAPNFPNLKHLDMSMCFHKDNCEGVISMLHHCPALESVLLVHEVHDL